MKLFYNKIVLIVSLFTLCLLTAVISCKHKNKDGDNDIPAAENQPALTAIFSAVIPSDVDTALKNKFVQANEIAKAQRLHDIFSWQSFLATNWPVDDNGNPLPKITDKGNPLWSDWKEVFEVYRDSGQAPERWGSERNPPTFIKNLFVKDKSLYNKHLKRILYLNNKLGNIANETLQAFAGPLYDQNGKLVRYEVLLNRPEFAYIVNNKLYNWDGQIAFSKTHDSLANFPSGVFREKDSVGAIEIKLAWKVLDPDKDIAARYFAMDSYVMNIDSTWSEAKVGLVGMHISHKCKSGKQWIWSTFEHVDNLQVNELDVFEHNGIKKQLLPSFNDPHCATCPVNIYQDTFQIPYSNPAQYIKYAIPKEKYIKGEKGAFIAQAQRVIPIPEATAALNAKVQQQLKAAGSVWQYYELIGTQWPKYQNVPPANNSYANLPGSVDNKPGGEPVPVYLTNLTMETYFQSANQSASGMIENSNPPNKVSHERYVFGTESCMGCHSSAGIAVSIDAKQGKNAPPNFGGQLTADFSWLLETKATWKK